MTIRFCDEQTRLLWQVEVKVGFGNEDMRMTGRATR